MARPRFGPNFLIRLLADTSQPIYVLNGEREIVFCNAACAAWTGVAANDLLGQRCDFHSAVLPNRAAEIATRLCPEPQIFTGEVQTIPVQIPLADGGVSRRAVTFSRLLNATGDTAAVWAAVSDHDLPVEPLAGAPSERESLAALHDQLQQMRDSWERRFQLDRFVGTSAIAQRIRDQIRFAIAGRGRTLIVGPPGSGCEHVARTIHAGRNSSSDSPLLPIDCVVLDAELIRSSIDAFLQHTRHQINSPPPTLLLLNVDQAATAAQNELARFCLSPREKMLTLATARTALLTLAERGTFRADLAHSLSTFAIELPPLVGRSEDVLLLSQMFLEEANRVGGKQIGGFSPDALRLLSLYSWPKNVDELADAVQFAWEHTEGILVGVSDLPPHLRAAADAAAHPRRPDPPIHLDDFLADIEKELLIRALRQAKGNKAKAAKLLNIHRARLLRRLEQLGLGPADEPSSS